MKRKVWLIGFMVLLLGFLFYWFQIRPSYILETCDSDAEWNARKQYNWGSYSPDDYKFFYNRCLAKNGLK